MISIIEDPQKKESFINLEKFAKEKNIKVMEVIMFDEEEAVQRVTAIHEEAERLNTAFGNLVTSYNKYVEILANKNKVKGAEKVVKKRNKK